MFRFPRLYASEDMGSPVEKLPKFIGSPQVPETGWNRLRELFDRDEVKNYPEELINIWKSTLVAGIVGMMYGGIPAARHARTRYIEQSQAEVYRNRLEAVRSAQDAAIRGFVRYGWRWSWRVAAFVTIFNDHRRSIPDVSWTGWICGRNSHWCIHGKANGETLREKKRRVRQETYKLKLEEWRARLDVTEGLVHEIADSDSVENDLEKLEELLKQPRNPGSSVQEES
ncbi:complex I assembly factor TIMMDC1, mitochondrial isoform X2 [Rhinoraja longicauda]